MSVEKGSTAVSQSTCLNDHDKESGVKTGPQYGCKSCKKPTHVLSGGFCEHCLAVHVVKDWLKKDGVK